MFRFPGVFIAPVAFPPDEIFPFALLVLPFVYNPLYLRDGERVKVMPSAPDCALTEHRCSPAITAELLVRAEPQAEELLSQQSGRD